MMETKLAKERYSKNKKAWGSWLKATEPLLQITSDIIIGLTLSYEIKTLSEAAEKHYNWKKSKVLGKNYLELCRLYHYPLPLITPGKAATPTQFLSEIQGFLPITHDSPTIRWTSTYLIDHDNEPFGLFILGKRSFHIALEGQTYTNSVQRYLDSMIDIIPGVFYIKDKQGIYLTCNQAMLDKGNLKSKLDVIGKTDFEIWPKLAEERVKNDLKVMKEGKTLELEETVILSNNKTMHLMSTKMPLRDEHEKIIGVICCALDITELKEAKETTEKSNRIKIEFIHNMEHDIRTPFNGIYALANLLYEEEMDLQKKEYLGEIANSGKELLTFCNTILDFSKIEMGILPIIQKKFNLSALLDQVITIEKPAIRQKNLSLTILQDPKLPQWIIGDDYRLLRILLNLLSNTIKFTKEGSIGLSTQVIKMDQRQVLIKFSVTDTGIGIPEEQINFIYEKFSKLNPSNTNRYKGCGLGLRVVKQFIDELGGEIEVSSEVNRGTSFNFILPFNLPLVQSENKNEIEGLI